MPGGGQGRKDEIEKSGVYPVSEMEGAKPDATIHGEASFGQGERGAEGYKDAGASEIFYLDDELEAAGTRPADISENMPDKGMSITLPQLGLIAATRGLIGVGAGLLFSNLLDRKQRKVIGLPLLALGILSTIPIARRIFHKKE